MDSFWSKVQRSDPSECWEWTAGKNPNGYGRIWVDGKVKLAHRVSYEIHNGPFPEGLHVLHSCDNPSCVNPDHLHLGTHRDNMREKVERGRTPSGETHGRSKLTSDQVRQIRSRYATGSVYQMDLGVEFGVSKSQISDIVNGKVWKGVEMSLQMDGTTSEPERTSTSTQNRKELR